MAVAGVVGYLGVPKNVKVFQCCKACTHIHTDQHKFTTRILCTTAGPQLSQATPTSFLLWHSMYAALINELW